MSADSRQLAFDSTASLPAAAAPEPPSAARPISPGPAQPERSSARLEELLNKARALEIAGRYEEAARLLDTVPALDPAKREALEIRTTPKRIDENVQFSVYRPSVIEPAKWYSLLVFTHLSSRRPDAPPDEPDPLQEVARRAKAVLGSRASEPAARVDAMAGIPEEGQLRIVPHGSGIEFNPPEHTFLWVHSIHQVEFTLRADAAMEGRIARGSIDVYLGALAVAHIPLAIPVEAHVDPREQPIAHTAHPHRKLFASYSHQDEAIVRQFELYAKGLGDRYLRDVIDLRAGEVWHPRLAELIESADVFQLFWSRNSMESVFVRQEWEHALRVPKQDFIRPVYWEVPFPKREGLPPAGLSRLHFAFVGARAATVGVPGGLPRDVSREQELARVREEHARREAEARERAEYEQRRASLEAEQRTDARAREEARRAELQRPRKEDERRWQEREREYEAGRRAGSELRDCDAVERARHHTEATRPAADSASSRRLWLIVLALGILVAALLRWC